MCCEKCSNLFKTLNPCCRIYCFCCCMHSIHSTEYVFGRRKRIIIVLYVFYKVILCVSPGKQMTELQLPFSVPPPKTRSFLLFLFFRLHLRHVYQKLKMEVSNIFPASPFLRLTRRDAAGWKARVGHMTLVQPLPYILFMSKTLTAGNVHL